MKHKLLLFISAFAVISSFSSYSQPAVTLETVASGFIKPLHIVNSGDSRLFIVEQDGKIKILHNDGTITTFLNIDSKVKSTGNEQGLLGLVFHPNYSSNGFFYVNYINNSGHTNISRFSVSTSNPDVANVNSELVLLTITQPFDNHNGGDLKFGPDGYLYIAMGDGGSGGDPGNRAQDLTVLLGKILRINVDSGSPYSIPASNPFVGVAGADEIWSYGLRNPWRFSFDRLTGDMWIGDVGQGAWEEIDFQSANDPGGDNYGWRCYEGTQPYNTSSCNLTEPFTFPVYEYPHDYNTGGFSVTGGFVYRGTQYPDLFGKYIFCDYVSGNFWTTLSDGMGNWNTTQLALNQPSISSFGEAANGELYAANLSSGEIYHLTNCGPVTNVMVTNITSQSATISWDNSGASSYKIIYQAPGSPSNKVTTTGTSVNLTGLSPSTFYTVKIRNRCPGVPGGYTASSSFTTDPAKFAVLSELQTFKIYPNPGSGLFMIENENDLQKVSVLDATGKELMNIVADGEETISLNLTSFTPGIYLIKMIDDNQFVHTEKLILEH